MTRCAMLLAVCCGMALATRGADREMAGATQVARLIEQLAHEDFRIRQAAAKGIEELGPAALPELIKAKDHKDLEVRAKVRAWIPRFERDALIAPKRLCLSINPTEEGEAVTIKEALDTIRKRSGCKISYEGGNDTVAQPIDVKNATFWETLDQFCGNEGLAILSVGNALHIHRPQEPHAIYRASSPLICRNGAFRLVATEICLVKSIMLNANQNKDRGTMQVVLGAQAEPGLPITDFGHVRVTEAVDNLGETMLDKHLPKEAPFVLPRKIGRDRKISANFVMNLLGPCKGATRIQALKGEMSVFLLKEEKFQTIADNLNAAKGAKCDMDEFSMVVDDLKMNEVRTSISLRITGSGRDHFCVEDLELHDAQGNAILKRDGHVEAIDRQTVLVKAVFRDEKTAKAGTPSKLVYRTGKKTEVVIPFAFKNLEMP